ncbi:fibronectin type III domain-containing protein [Actinocrispum wychmicini]|uniref:Parallel beta helix pectate lyase-like protein n=1 Tax=Actinocrispum wychmicini TaxID=1213861 RepID=A0A4R2J743_9PSEU|nr:fibronectin type III domain-containing protein [Actinocrispum wychmicini]TCO52318.1 parallel beta helix pectate lyase-like protein [Actinocrispum wychmicini]
MRYRQFATWSAVVTVAALAVFSGSAGAAEGRFSQDVYVAPWGTDQGPGSALLPARTPQRARDLVRARSRGMTGDVTVHLAPGVYRLKEPLVLDARDSGVNGHKVIWQGAGAAVLSGGRQVTGWRPVAGRPGLFAAPAPQGLDNTRQLYVNGIRAQRARGTSPVTLTATDTGYVASADTLAHWRNPGDIEMVYTAGEVLWNIERYGLGQWTEPRCPVGKVDGTTVTMAQPCWDNSTKRVVFPNIPGRTVNMVGPGDLTSHRRPAYLENGFELLDQPGEWYLDRSEHTVYYMPRPGEPLWDVEMPALEKLVDGQGTARNPVHDIAFRGINFEYATWLTPSSPEGFSEIQAGYTITGPTGYATQGLCQFVDGGTCPYASWTKEPGNVSVEHGQRVEFSDSVFTHLGATGLDLGDGSQDAVVKGNVFTDISGNGVAIGGVDQPQPGTDADITRNVTVADNHLYALPREFHGGVAIINGYSQHDTITHNQIDHVAYSAISMGWGGWPDKIGSPATPNVSHDNAVSNNLIFDYMLMLDDGGGVYTQGITGTSLADGEKVTGNVIHDQWGLGKNVYTDNGCTYETVQGNVLYNAAYASVGSTHVDYRDDLRNNDPTLIQGNYWEQGDADGTNKGVVTSGNHILAGNPPADVIAAAGLEAPYRHLLQKPVTLPSVPEAPSRVGTFAADGKLYVTWNPTFADNGSALTSYVVTANGVTTTISADDFAKTGYAVVPGLANGSAYTVTVAATNRFGTSEQSLPAAPVTPGPLAGVSAAAPTSLKARADGSAVSLRWNPPTATGDTPVIGYQVTGSDGRTITVTGRDALVTQPTTKTMTRTMGGFAPATKYTFTIAAITGTGVGAPASVSVTTR